MEINGENSKTDFSSFELKAHIWANVLNRTSDTQFWGDLLIAGTQENYFLVSI